MLRLIPSPIHRMLAISCLLGVALLAFRIWFSGSFAFTFLPWNLFLAFIPFAISHALLRKGVPNRWKLMTVLPVWLLFFPNAPYIITDLYHITYAQAMPVWFDMAMILTYAWNGLLLGFLSLMDMEHAVTQRTNRLAGRMFSVSVLVLAGFGIYLGRFLRWNSWDIVTHPWLLFHDIGHRLLHPMEHPRTLGVTVVFSLFLLFSYFTLDVLVRKGHSAAAVRA